MISKVFIKNEDMFLGFKIVAIEEIKPFDLMIFVFWQLKNGPLMFNSVSCQTSMYPALVYH